MNRYDVSQIKKQCKLYGRTYTDLENGILYFNWTCGGVEAEFYGTYLAAEFNILPDSRIENAAGDKQGDFDRMEEKDILDWPWIAVIADGAKEPYQKILLDRPIKKVILFFDELQECHRIRIVKLNENYRTSIGIRALFSDGVLQEHSEKYRKRKKIEFIGDSITCGFGNMATDGNREFYTTDENGWRTHGSIAAERLNMDASFISVSGITVARRMDIAAPYVMEELYPYTDRIIQDRLGGKEGYELWDFKNNPQDYVVINLGTNDSTIVMLSDNPTAEADAFEEDYTRLLRTIRKLNGLQTRIICALGCIDYYLYDKIQSAVKKLQNETGDQRIYCMKYTKMLNIGPDVGACFHPSAYRQEKMAGELVRFIKKLGDED